MSTAFWVALGSAIGGLGRYWCVGLVASHHAAAFPWGTFAVNLVGSAGIGLVAGLSMGDGRFVLDAPAREFLTIGVFGGFTTFSSFSLQSLKLLQQGDWPTACAYALASVLLCVLGAGVGFAAGAGWAR